MFREACLEEGAGRRIWMGLDQGPEGQSAQGEF